MRILFKKFLGFTLIELMIVVTISLILAVVAGVSLNSRLNISRLEQAAQTLISDMRYARSAAMFKNCPVRVVFCNDRNCNSTTVAAVAGTASASSFVGSGSTPARYYAMIRESQKEDPSGATPCYNANAVNALSSPSDPWQYWDFDRRPQSIPQGVVFTSVYTPLPGADVSAAVYDWSSTSSAGASNSIYFSQSAGQLTVPGTGTASNGDAIAFQLSLESCAPADASSDCLAYLITVGSGGAMNMVKCRPTGSRSANATLSDACFP